MSLYHEKAAQAQALLAELDLGCWMTFARETVVSPDPGIDLVVGVNVTWNSAFIFGRNGERIAIVGRYDAPDVRRSAIFDTVIGYDEGMREDLIAALTTIDPPSIGLNYSVDDKTADGLTHGMWLMLHDLLRDTPFPARFTSAEGLLGRLRARKTPAEVERIRAAITMTEEIVDLIGAQIVVGKSEADIGAFVHEQFRARGVPSAWAWEGCPIVNSGPESDPGHAAPRADIMIAPGHLVHIDLGVQLDDYCSDIQRMWYVRRPGETAPPPAIQHAFATVLQAIDAGAAILRPGVRGFEVDAVAREVIVDNGYEEYRHAFGHGLGRACHDGGPLLGPRWERYGSTPDMLIEAGHVYTLELGVMTEAGYLGLEEDVLVTETGCVFLSTQQRELRML
ncbi:MAG TPA: Xaa-Pro peptidase family protein [Roseiflexaceae bacterium]|nr:Xaa-Pro peptidase family protein [Roseiflexaceae bacterium]HMP39218.1 Xaa-Pro peptidase family protein [Roseiflexaceae bacterium]